MTEIRSDRPSSEIISCLKTLLLISDGEKDALLELLLEGAYTFACCYTRCEEIPSAVLVRMTGEDYTRGLGISKRSRAGMSEEYLNGYSVPVMTILKSMRKIKCV